MKEIQGTDQSPWDLGFALVAEVWSDSQPAQHPGAGRGALPLTRLHT